jgi:hypothetical protein
MYVNLIVPRRVGKGIREDQQVITVTQLFPNELIEINGSRNTVMPVKNMVPRFFHPVASNCMITYIS